MEGMLDRCGSALWNMVEVLGGEYAAVAEERLRTRVRKWGYMVLVMWWRIWLCGQDQSSRAVDI